MAAQQGPQIQINATDLSIGQRFMFTPIVLENYDTCQVVDFESIGDPETRILFNNVATSLALPADEVDSLTEAGRRLLREAPEFRDLVVRIQSLDKGDRTDNAASTRRPPRHSFYKGPSVVTISHPAPFDP